MRCDKESIVCATPAGGGERGGVKAVGGPQATRPELS